MTQLAAILTTMRGGFRKARKLNSTSRKLRSACRSTPAIKLAAPTLVASWSKEATNHLNPSAPGDDGVGRLFQFLAEISPASKRYEGCGAFFLARIAAWSPGYRRRQNTQPYPYICLGDPSEPLKVQSTGADQLSGRSWWPASDQEWCVTKPLLYWNFGDVVLAMGNWAASQRLGIPGLMPQLFPLKT